MNSPILSCYNTDKFFIEFWKGKYQLPAPSQHQQAEMNEDEKSALWYVAGYIIKKVKARLWKKKKHDMADKLKQLLEDSEIDDNVTSGTTEENNPKEWLELVNRGELTRCSNDFYEYLTVVKLAIKETVLLPHTKSVPLPETTRTLLNSQNIKATWASLFEEEIEENEIVHLLILEEYLKIRCFGYTNKLMEMYKNKKEVNLQKSKSFRAQVSSSIQ